MAINFFNWKHPYLLVLQRLCSFAFRIVCRMTLLCYIFRTCVRRICKPSSFAQFVNWSDFIANVDESSNSRNTADVSISFTTSQNSGSFTMTDVDSSAVTMQSKIWNQLVSFKRKLLGDSSVLPSAMLETVSKKSRSVLSQQSNSADMPLYSDDPEHLKVEEMHDMSASNSTVVVIPEDSTEVHNNTPDSLEPDVLLLGDELVMLFDSDNQKETSFNTTPTSGTKRRKKQKSSKKADGKLRPNYFVAVQITDLDIIKRVGEIQECILKQNELLKPSMIALPTLHLTMLVMHLADELQLNRAKVALDECCKAVLELSLKLPTLRISGVDHFQNSVVFAQVQADEEFDRLLAIANMTTDHFKQQGLLSEYSDTKGFHPHLTIMKLSKAPRLRKEGIKKLDKSLYEEHSETFFGYQPVTSLQLCSMNAPKDKKTRYYKILHEVRLGTA